MTEQFKLPGSSYEEVSKIIQGYASLDKSASLTDVSNVTGIPDTTVSRNSGFLISLGVIERGAKKAATELGKSLGRALLHGQEEEVRRLYRDIVSENEFLKNIVGAVRIRKGMDENSLRSHIAYSAGAKKNAYTTTGAGTVIEILKTAGSLIDEDGKIVVGSTPSTEGSSRQPSPATPTAELERSSTLKADTEAGYSSGEFKMSVERSRANFDIKINIEVKCEPGDLDTLGQKLRKVIQDFNAEEEQTPEDDHAAE